MSAIDLETIIVAGSYEGKVHGFVPKFDSKTNSHSFHQLFVQSAHTASVRTVSLYGKWLASGSADETIR
jgi:WD40 repeat protein